MKPYAPEEDKAISDNADKMTVKEIAKLINRSWQSVRARARKIGVEMRKNPPYTPDDDKAIRKYAKTKSCEEIGKLLNRTKYGIRARAQKIGVSLVKHGEHHHASVYPNDDVRLVKALIDDGEMKPSKIAETMEMNIHTVRCIKRGEIRNKDLA
ncbi:hypothetical protein [Vibrio harveyi]|uniref:hypothetical protein n=1 Tax=Vibrio harveyi TaxID=669 RepID=UPI00165E6F2A|nr:hypothetical protein [Vibrio harveyi]